MKKILHLIDSLLIGGAQTHLVTILKCVDRERYSHVVYSLTDGLDLAGEIECLGVKVFSLSLQEAFKLKKWTIIIRAVSKMLKEERPDILETHLIWSRIIGTIAFAMIGRKKIISFEQGDIYNTGRRYMIVNFLVSFFVDVIVTCSDAMKKWIFKNYGFLSYTKVEVMHNCVLADFFKPKHNSGDFRRILGLGQDEVVIGSIGTLGKIKDKGMKYCIDAMSILTKNHNNIKLVIVGDGDLRAILEEQSKDLRLEGRVKFLGSRRDIDLILNAIDIFVLASIFEPFGIALIEAMSMEKAVLGSASGGIREIIEDGATGFLFAPRDSKGIADIVDRLIKDERLRKEMGIRARKSVEERFDAKKYVKRLESIYTSLLKRGK